MLQSLRAVNTSLCASIKSEASPYLLDKVIVYLAAPFDDILRVRPLSEPTAMSV